MNEITKQEARLEEAQAHIEKGENLKATKILQEVLKEKIENPKALQMLGQITYQDKNYDLARDLFKESLKLDPTQGIVWSYLGQVQNDLRQNQDAAESFKKALALNPSLSRPYLNLGNIKLTSGEREEGIKMVEKALDLNPELVGGYLALGKAKGIKIGDRHFKNIETLAKKFPKDSEAQGFLHFALSYVYEQAGDTKKFFFHLKKANDINRPKDGAWKTNLSKRIKNLKKISTPEFLNDRVDERFKIYTPIFIVGMPRSGTTLTDQIFATHSQCFGGDELQYFSKYLDRVTQSGVGAGGVINYPKLEMKDFSHVATLYQKRVQELAPGTPYISDKMPWNFMLVGLISKILPWAKIIHIHRDPLDCGFSCFRSPLPKDLMFASGMREYAFYRARYQEIMDFWQETVPERFINLSYEKMVNSPEQELKRVLSYVGLPWENDLLNFHKTKRQVRTISSDQVNKPLNKNSIGKAMKYQKELAPMIKALKKYGLK